MSRRSIRTSLLLGTTLGILTVLIGAGVAVDRSVRSAMVQQLDSELERQASFLASTAELTEKGIELGYDELMLGDDGSGRDPLYVRMVDEDGLQLFASPGFPSGIERTKSSVGEFRAHSVSVDGGHDLRVATLTFRVRVDIELEDLEQAQKDGEALEWAAAILTTTPPGSESTEEFERRGDATENHDEEERQGDDAEDDDVDERQDDDAENDDVDDEKQVVIPEHLVPVLELTLARSMTQLTAVAAQIRSALAVVGAAAGAVSVVLLGVVIQRNLDPLARLASRISNLDESDLAQRVALESAPKEIEPVVFQLNHLLSKLEAAFQRERNFSSDIAHELRTPLAGIRTTMEVELSKPRTAGEYEQCLRDTLVIVLQLQDMVQTLLQLARLEGGQEILVRSGVDLVSVAKSSWKPLEAVAQSRQLKVDWSLPPERMVSTDPALAGSAFSNLLENAVVHAEDGGYVRIELEEDGNETSFRVSNSGSDVAQEDVPNLLRRFSRIDASRRSSGGHYGLGLALVRQISQVLELPLNIESHKGGEFQVRLSFPTSP